MEKKEDFPLGDTTKEYCTFCASEDGSMQSYDEKLESMANFIVKTQGLTKQVAKETAEYMLKQLPAWRDIK